MASNFNDTLPAAPAGGVNVKWQTDGAGNDSAYVPISPATTALIPGEALVSYDATTGLFTQASPSTAASISIAYNALPASTNVSTEGTLDWLFWFTTTLMGSLPDDGNTISTAMHKMQGGRQISNVHLAGATAVSASGAFPTTTFTFSAGDANGTPASGTLTTSSGYFLTGGNYVGLAFTVPCDTFTRVIRIYVSNGNPYTVTCTSSDGSINHSESRSSSNDQIVITYNSAVNGAQMSVFVGNSNSTTSNIQMPVITLSTV